MRPARSASDARSSPPHEVRLIGGRLKRSKLPVLDRPGLRPTPDRVRETLFNWLGQDLTGWRVLDAFAGSGALGLEAASRGAAEVQLLENDARLVDSLRSTCQRLNAVQVKVDQGDALSWMARAVSARVVFDLVLLDPPFSADLFGAALAAARPLLATQGRLYLEADRAFDATELAADGWQVWRHGKAGAVFFYVLMTVVPASND